MGSYVYFPNCSNGGMDFYLFHSSIHPNGTWMRIGCGVNMTQGVARNRVTIRHFAIFRVGKTTTLKIANTL